MTSRAAARSCQGPHTCRALRKQLGWERFHRKLAGATGLEPATSSVTDLGPLILLVSVRFLDT
jgi:hypothetical protein